MPRSFLVLFRERGSTTTILGEEKSSKGDDDLFVILGPSGGGKTTLLRIIAGLVEPDADVIKINGKEMNGVPPLREKYSDGVPELCSVPPHVRIRQYSPQHEDTKDEEGRNR
ncbi:MAG: hypothetical protein AT710_07900 [Thermocladium sp. ECH_B]|nr:MAG: hypothetical protein AT710_07900 [Thermocladium sp. ECH_B]